MELARNKNATPLPVIKTHCGLRLPPERHCLLSANYKLRASEVQPKKLTKSALDRNIPKTKASGTGLKRQSVNAAKTQNVTIPKPVFKFSGNSNAKSNGTATPKIQSVSVGGQQIKFEPDIKMEMDDDYSNDMRGIKRKRDDDDDDDFEAVGYS